MKPILFEKDATTFTSLGIARLPDAISCTVTEERNGEYELELVYPVSGRYFSEIIEDRIIVCIPHDGGTKQAFRIYRIETPLDGQVVVNARHISYQLNFVPVLPVSGSGATAQGMMTALAGSALENCPFSFESDIATTADYNIQYPVALKSALGGMEGSVLDVFGGEFEWDNWTVKLHAARGADNGVRITYGKNLTDLSRSVDIGDMITGVAAYYIGIDENGAEIKVFSSPAVISNANASLYSHPRTVALDVSAEFETIPTTEQVTSYATSYLASTTLAEVSEAITVDFVALWQTPEYKDYAPLERVGLCDTVYIGYKQLGVSVKKKVTRTVWNVLLDRYDLIELGGEATIADTLSTLQTGSDSTAIEVARLASKLANLPNGLKIQYGEATTSSGSATVTFNVAFAADPVVFCEAIGGSTSSVFDARPSGISTTGFTIKCTRTSGSSVSTFDGAVNWVAIGV